MENEALGQQNADSTAAARRKNEIGLPLIALCLVIVPILAFLFLESLLRLDDLLAFLLLFMLLSPIAGMITGIFSLVRGKGRIGLAGKILAITAISLPAIFIIFPILLVVFDLFAGGTGTTGSVSEM